MLLTALFHLSLMVCPESAIYLICDDLCFKFSSLLLFRAVHPLEMHTVNEHEYSCMISNDKNIKMHIPLFPNPIPTRKTCQCICTHTCDQYIPRPLE